MNPSPAFIQALSEERVAAREQLYRSSSADLRVEAIRRLADLDDVEAWALSTPVLENP